MKTRTIALGILTALLLSMAACARQTSPESTNTTQQTPSETTAATQQTSPETTEESTAITYTYQVRAMQNVYYCAYYPDGAYVPNSPDPTSAWDKVGVRTQCPKCGEENVSMYRFDPSELDFSSGDTVQYFGTDSCWDCKWDYNMEQFTWVVSVTRIPE